MRDLRRRRNLSQSELASLAGVSRQLVGALESGRHLPRVDAAMRLARALDIEVEELFGQGRPPEDVLTGGPPPEGAPLRYGQVGDRFVFAVSGAGASGWESADGVFEGGRIRRLGSAAPGAVMVGCEPGLRVIEADLRELGRAAMAIAASSHTAVTTLGAGRAHVGVVHGTSGNLPETDADVQRYLLCAWRVGLAASNDAAPGWAEAATSGTVPVVQRESGAGVQSAFEAVAGPSVPGPRSTSHLESVRMAVATGMPAVTIEPAALALGASFHAIETHEAQLWVPTPLVGDPVVEAVLNEIVGDRFRRRLGSVGGYDLAQIGKRAA